MNCVSTGLESRGSRRRGGGRLGVEQLSFCRVDVWKEAGGPGKASL